MPLNCHFEELDQATRDYLHDVRARKGAGTPGVYVPGKNPWPLVAIGFGPLAGLILFFAPVGSGKPAWAIACMQTAGLLVGGWSVLYAVRRWVPGRSGWYGGFFHYFDPLSVYEVNGERVTVHSLKTVRGVEAFTNGANGGVDFDLGDDRGFAVRLKPASAGRDVEEYYAAMAELEADGNAQWAMTDPAVLGAAAKYLTAEDAPPRDTGDLKLEVDGVPAEPGRDRRAGWGLLPLAAIFAAGAGFFVLAMLLNAPVNDEFAFDRAKAAGAPGLRGYLLDDRNTRHRDEAKQLLAKCYDRPVFQLQNSPPGKKPEVRAGLMKLLDSLRTAETAVVSIQVKQKNADAASASTETATRLRTDLADGLARSIGPELIAFVAPPDDKPAHLSLTYEIPLAKPGQTVTDVNVSVEVRTDVDQPPVSATSWTVSLPLNPGMATTQVMDLLKIELSRELVGEWKPAPPPVFNTDGDW